MRKVLAGLMAGVLAAAVWAAPGQESAMQFLEEKAGVQAPAEPSVEVKPLDPRQNDRVQDIARGIRCMVCEEQVPLSEAASAMALSMKEQIADDVRAGKSDDEIYESLVKKYGESVLYRPALQMQTVLLWLGPLLVLLLAAGLWARLVCRPQAPARGEDLAWALHVLKGEEEVMAADRREDARCTR